MGNSTKELVNAFNLNNYFSDKISTNFTVEGKKIVGLFAGDTNIGEYLRRMEKEIIGRHYGTREIANGYYNLDCFPFVSGANHDEEYLGNGIVKVKLKDSTNNEVIRNLRVHFANEFKRAVGAKVVARLQKAGVMEKEAYEWIKGTVGTGAIGKPYLYCIAFSDEYLKRKYDSETFEVLKGMYIQEFNSRLEACGLKSSDFYEYKDDMLYIKDVSDKVVKSVAEYVKKEVALDFRTPGSIESKVENCKNVLSELILEATGKFVDGYDYDDFTDEKKIKNGHSFALIPFIEENGQLKSLSFNDAGKINRVFNGGIFNGFHCISDIRGKTANPQFANCKEPVYAFSNKQIALLLPIIMQSPIAYNQIDGRFEFAVDLENFKRRGSSRSSSTVTSPFNSPTHAEPPRTPPEQTGARFFESEGNRDSGIGESPPRPEDSVAHSSSDDPGSFLEQSQAQRFPTRSQGEELGRSPRRGSEKKQVLHNPVNLAGTSKGFSPSLQLNSIAVSYGVSGPSSSLQSVGAAQNRWLPQGTSGNKWTSSLQFTQPEPIDLSWTQSGPSSSKGANESGSAGASTWDQPIGFWSSPAPSAEPSLWQPSRPSSSKGANPVGTNPWAQQTNRWSLPAPSAGLWSLPQSGPSSSRGANESMRTGKSIWYVPSSYSPGVEDVNDVEPEKQQVSDECSEAKSQKSESPKKHGGIFQKIKDLCSSPSKSKQRDAGLKRHNVGRDTTRSMPTISVTKKTLLSERSASERKAKSNPPSKVTSPTHEGAPGGLKPLTSDERKELRPFLSPELQKKLDSNSFSPGEEQHLYLTHTLSGKRELSRSLCEGKESQLLRLTKAQLPDNSSSKRDSGYSSGLPASLAVPHKESVSSEVKECRTVEHTRETWGKRI